MRALIIQVPKNKGVKILEIAKQLEGKNLSVVHGSDGERKLDVIHAAFSNDKIDRFISEINKIDDVQILLYPQGVLSMYPPADEAPEQVTDIEARSPIEIFLAGLQSVGSWEGFIGYAVITSFIVWIGLFTNTIYLLVAAMLVAPFAGPAMNTAIASARGDWPLLKQSMIRYFVSIAITIAGTYLLSLIFQQQVATPLMVDTSQISFTALLLALSAGAAGALNIVQSERDSLVSGAAVGMLVAASLAPPVGIVGMAIAIGNWEMVRSGIFLLFLQLIGINLTGSLVFRMFGLTSKGPRYKRGKKGIFAISLIVTIALAGSMLYLQLHQSPDLQRASRAQRANAEIQTLVQSFDQIELVESSVRFAATQNTLLCILYVQIKPDLENVRRAAIKNDLILMIQQRLLNEGFQLTPLVNVILVAPP